MKSWKTEEANVFFYFFSIKNGENAQLCTYKEKLQSIADYIWIKGLTRFERRTDPRENNIMVSFFIFILDMSRLLIWA